MENHHLRRDRDHDEDEDAQFLTIRIDRSGSSQLAKYKQVRTDGSRKRTVQRASAAKAGCTADETSMNGWQATCLSTEDLMETLLTDIRYGFRLLQKNPGFLLVAVVTLALGIGANTTIFSVINATLLKPISYPDPDRLVAVFESSIRDRTDQNIVSAPNFTDWQRQNDVFENMALLDSAGRGYDLASHGQQPERVSGLRVSAGFFPVLGVRPMLGRNFLPEEEWPGKDHVVVLSYALWHERYHADRSLIGKPIKIDGEAFTVVGVMPPDFHFQFWSAPRLLWVPVGYTQGDSNRGAHSFLVFARLKRGVTLDQARTEMDVIGRRLAKAYPQDNPGRTAIVLPLSDVDMKELRTTMLTLFAAVGFVLLIACVNVANLMLARGAARQKELAMRIAVGATRLRIVRQLLTESVLLALLGGVAGLFLASWATKLLVLVVPEGFRFMPLRPLDTITVDGKVLAFTFVASCLTGILFGLMPALGALRTDVNDLLRQRGSGGPGERASRFRYALVASEMALAMIVLAGAGLMIESMARLLGVDPGFDPKNVLTMSATTPQIDLYNGPPVRARFCQDLQERIGSLPGIVSVSSIAHLPMRGGAGRGFAIEGRPDPGVEINRERAIALRAQIGCAPCAFHFSAGREFSFRDTVDAPGVILINQSMAQRYWPKENPVGKRIKLGLFQSKSPWLTVVGVYQNVRSGGLDRNRTHSSSVLMPRLPGHLWRLWSGRYRRPARMKSQLGTRSRRSTQIEPSPEWRRWKT